LLAAGAAQVHSERMSTLTPRRQEASLAARLNWLRAGVLGANDGIVSTAGLVVGVAGATSDSVALFIAGVAGMVAGALSMAGGEYVSVSTQRDTETAALRAVRNTLRSQPAAHLDRLAAAYESDGVPPALARQIAAELTGHDAVAAHARAVLRIDPDDHTNPWHAALASMLSFTIGALVPLLAIVLAPVPARLPITIVAVLIALAVTGYCSARLGGAPVVRPVLRNLVVGALAMGVTYLAGSLVGAQL
jgi:vacuolar iron transporter family protein